MTKTLDADTIRNIEQYDAEQRFKYLLKEVKSNAEIWILADTDGCVMLNTEDEDCVPVWPNETFAKAWATEEWGDCQAKAIPLQKWLNDWTSGLLDDDLAVVVFPNQNNEGVVVFPDELDAELRKNKR